MQGVMERDIRENLLKMFRFKCFSIPKALPEKETPNENEKEREREREREREERERERERERREREREANLQVMIKRMSRVL